MGKEEPRKAGFPWDLGLPFGKPIICALLLQNMKFERTTKDEKETTL